MPRYFFHSRDDGDLVVDEVGLDLPDLEQVKRFASRALAEIAVDVLPGASQRRLGIDVTDEHDGAVLTTELTFEARVHTSLEQRPD